MIALVCTIIAAGSFLSAIRSGSEASRLAVSGVISLVLGIGSFLIGGALVALGIYLIVRARRADPIAAAQHRDLVAAVQGEHDRIHREYEHAMDRWKRLYYCGRDDCVFIPGENGSAPVTEMNTYLAIAPTGLKAN
jgi:hypothetical protein